MLVAAFIDDMLFQSKVSTAAQAAEAQVRFGNDVTTLGSPCSGRAWDLLIVDLGLAAQDPVALITALRRALPETPIVAFGSHVEHELFARATAAGSTEVLPRSQFVQRLPALLGAIS